MSHEAHSSAAHHEPKPYANAFGIFLGLLIWWSAAGALIYCLLRYIFKIEG